MTPRRTVNASRWMEHAPQAMLVLQRTLVSQEACPWRVGRVKAAQCKPIATAAYRTSGGTTCCVRCFLEFIIKGSYRVVVSLSDFYFWLELGG